jgi:polar amino acid transport system substrate-binding protein
MMKFFLVPIVAAALSFTATKPASALETYVVGVESMVYLPHYEFSDGEYRGFAAALLNAFAADKSYRFDYRPLPVARLFASLVSGDIDFKYPDNAVWAGELKKGKGVVYSDPVVSVINGVVVQPDNKGKGLAAIKTLGMVRGFTAFEWRPRVEAGHVALVENSSFVGLVQQAAIGRVDGAYANVAVVRYILETVLKEPGALVFDPDLPHTPTSYALSSVKHPKVIGEFNAWLAANAVRVAKMKAEYGVSETQ